MHRRAHWHLDFLSGLTGVEKVKAKHATVKFAGFEPLRYIKDQKVVLGLVTSKTPELEDKDAVIARIHEAARYVPLEQLSISPQCGFASTEEGNMLTEEEQWAKIRLIREIADEVWGKE